jgi:hypothetical protein
MGRPIGRAQSGYEQALFVRAQQGGLWHRWDVEPAEPQGFAVGESVAAKVNSGRWIIQCRCGGAQLATPGQDRFFCIDCLNDYVGRQWVRVEWPASVAGIEAVLEARQDPHTQSWELGESVEDLQAENDAHGVA